MIAASNRESVLILRHDPNVSMGSIAAVLAENGLAPRQIDLFETVPDDLPWDEISGLISLGGAMSANDGDKFPFLVRELDWLREAARRNVPTFGICLGAQLLAKALGAKVYRNPQTEIGWYEIELLPATAGDRVFHGCAAKETVFHWHSDTFDLPDGAVQLARSPACRQQSFRFGKFTYGLQFHVEMTPGLMELWLREHEAGTAACGSDRIDAAAIRSAAATAFPAMNVFSERILCRFAELCNSTHGKKRLKLGSERRGE
jgi:GMP synthase-like glutamine amidotransferase